MKEKQKIIIIIISIIFIGIVIYYANTKEETSNLDELNSYDGQAEIKENDTNENIIESERKTAKQITIYITGAVNQPGVYTLPEGSRIADAIEQAKGIQENADNTKINLAYKIEDGMQITIPTKQQNNENQENYITTEIGTQKKEAQQINAKSDNKKININTATKEELESLTGIGTSTSEKIIQYRKEKGKFKTIEEIKNVSGIGENKYKNIKDKITV